MHPETGLLTADSTKAERDKERENWEQESLHITEEQAAEIEGTLDQAVKNETITVKDKIAIEARIANLSPEDQRQAERLVLDYVKKIETHVRKYEDRVREEAKKTGIPEKDVKDKLKAYRKKTKEKREEDEKEFPHWIEEGKKHQKDVEQVLKESPHFSKGGKLTSEGEKFLEQWKKLSLSDREKEKKKLIREIKILDEASRECRNNYQAAKFCFGNGAYNEALRLMRINQRLCKRYPNSSQLQEYSAWASSDIENLKYENNKAREIEKRREDVQVCMNVKDYKKALQLSTEARALMQRFLKKTYDGKLGPWQKGKEEKLRGEQWITPYMRKLEQRVKEEDRAVSFRYDEEVKEELKEKEEGELGKKVIDQAMAGAQTQVLIKGGTDMVRKLQEKEAGEMRPIITKQQEVGEKTEEDLKEKTVSVFREQERHQPEEEQRKIIRSGASITLVTNQSDQKFNTQERVEVEMGERLIRTEEILITRLAQEGSITKEVEQKEKARIQTLRAGRTFGKEILKYQKEQGRILVEGVDQEKTKERITRLLIKKREQDELSKTKKPVSIEELRKVEKTKKKKILADALQAAA